MMKARNATLGIGPSRAMPRTLVLAAAIAMGLGTMAGCPPPINRCLNVKCPAGLHCDQDTGACVQTVITCAQGFTLCSDQCRNLQSDNANCGACNNQCPTPTSCQNGSCVAPPPPVVHLTNLHIKFHTNDDDKDGDTSVTVTIAGGARWAQTGQEKYGDGTDVVKPLMPSSVLLSDIANKTVEICIQPNGHDTWKFNYEVAANRSDGGIYSLQVSNMRLDQNSRCTSATMPSQ